jgi:hypothetical protein
MMKKITTILLTLTLASTAFSMGARQKCPSDDQFKREFESEKVAQLALDINKNFRQATFRMELDFSSVPHAQDRDFNVYYYVQYLYNQSPWIAKRIEQYPEAARCRSYFSAQTMANDLRYLKANYSGNLFRPTTKDQLEAAMAMTDEMLTYYETK